MNQLKNENQNNNGKVSELKKVGLVSDAHGIRGEVYIILFSGDNTWIDDIKTIFLASSPSHSAGSKTQLEIKKLKSFKKGFICSFQGIITRNQAEEFKKMEVWIDANLFVSEDGDQPFLSELLDFSVVDTLLGDLGKVVGFSSNGEQDLLILSHLVNSQSVEIPFIKQFVIDVDYTAKKITTTLPEGLIEINEKD